MYLVSPSLRVAILCDYCRVLAVSDLRCPVLSRPEPRRFHRSPLAELSVSGVSWQVSALKSVAQI